MSLNKRDAEHVFQRLRDGLVPERGLDTFAVGIERHLAEIHRLLDLAEHDEGLVKFLRGGYGCGKTFMARLAVLEAQARGFATSFVVVSDNDLHFHRFDDVYSKVVTLLGTDICPRGALGDILDRWIARVEDALIDGGEDEEAAGFDGKVRARIAQDLAAMTRGSAPEDFVRVVQTIFELKQEGELGEAGALLSWLSGSGHVAASAKKRARIKGDIKSQDALAYLRGVVEIVKAAGYKGLVIIIDEAETILRMRRDVRGKSMNGIRQICDASSSYPGLLWFITGTPEFFDTRRGVAGLQPLHDRIKFIKEGDFVSLRQAQLLLEPFKEGRLKEVALRLREIFPATDRARLDTRVTPAFIERLVDDVTRGFNGDVGVVPRQFLRTLINRMDLVEEHEDYDPMTAAGFTPSDLRPEEAYAMEGKQGTDSEEPEDAEPIPVEQVW